MRVRRLTTMRRDGDASVARYPRKVQKVLKYKKLNKPRDVAQLVARLLWEQDVAGSNPVIPTNKTKFDLVPSLVLFFMTGFEVGAVVNDSLNGCQSRE